MAGEAKTSKFLLTEATLMIGPMANVFDLTPADHGVGLVKNVRAEVTHGWTELTQGVEQQVVYSVNNSIESMISAEVFEYTARNLAYGAQLDGSAANFAEFNTILTITTQLTSASTTIVLNTGGGASFTAGDFAVIQHLANDTVAVVKIASISVDTLTIAAGWTMPANTTFTTTGTRVFRVRREIQVGASTENSLFGVKIVGVLPEQKRPVVLIFPKVRITKGMSLAFDSQNFSNMPFEFKPYVLLPTDTHFAKFETNKQFMVLTP